LHLWIAIPVLQRQSPEHSIFPGRQCTRHTCIKTIQKELERKKEKGKRKKEKGRWEKAAHKGVKILGSRGNFGSGGVGKNRLMRQLYAL
jgi:hypothetical protein